MEAERAVPGVPAPLQEALAAAYRIERVLGRGGMATVFLAEDLRHSRLVAIKVLPPELSGRDDFPGGSAAKSGSPPGWCTLTSC